MSDFYLRLVPDDPRWVPSAEQSEAALRAVSAVTPDRFGGIKIDNPGGVCLVDCGELWKATFCPLCGAELSSAWAVERFDDAHDADEGYGDLDVTTPCCGGDTSLNALDYREPMAFATWWIEVDEPDRDRLTAEELDGLAAAYGRRVREIYARY